MNRYIKLSFLLSLCVVASGVGAMDPDLVQSVFRQKHIAETIGQALPTTKDLYALFRVNKLIKRNTDLLLEHRLEEEAINYSKALKTIQLCFLGQRCLFQNNEDFKNNILQAIRDFAQKNPNIWITLNLDRNELGNDLPFFEQLMQDIINLVHELNIDITRLSLVDNQLETLPEGLFTGLNQLREIYLLMNKLTALPDHIFAGLNQLKTLELEDNRLKALPEQIFAGLSQLEQLHLNSNRLAALQERLFNGLNQLQRLDLDSNGLTELPENIFAGLNQLQRLDLRYNQLALWRGDRVFAGLKQLTYLGLDVVEPVAESDKPNVSKALGAVGLGFPYERTFLKNDKAFLEKILKYIRDFAQTHPNTWIKLGLIGNDLGNNPVFFEQFMHDIINLVHELNIEIVELDLSRNGLKALPEHIFAGLNQLRSLGLYNNQLATLPEHIFDGLKQLKALVLTGNQLPKDQVLTVPQGCQIHR